MPRFFTERATPDEADILIEGRVTLHFRMIEGRVWKVSDTPHDRKGGRVPAKDFIGARKLAIQEMNKTKKAQAPPRSEIGKAPPDKNISDEHIARAVVKF